eukprot:TRINITY_DN5198_c0_g1_i1.p1 TRINITY_DN5198_c0_g1~~TRINITY_DN5198_c0_g1_i1.p1  ORF type:complete len:2650 (-),score=519.31 TRINITY_DN5198_c0_g1_i1:70-6840(-)
MAGLKDPQQKMIFFDMIWKLVFDKTQKIELCLHALAHLELLIVLPDFSQYREDRIWQLIEYSKQDISSAGISYQLLLRLILSYPRNMDIAQPQNQASYSQEYIAMKIQMKHSFLEFLFEEYEKFKQLSMQIAQNPEIQAYDLDYQLLAGRMSYYYEIRNRHNILDVLLYLLSDQEQLSLTSSVEGWDRSFLRLWNLSVVNPLTLKERESAVTWFIRLREKRHPQDKHLALSNSATSYLFTKILNYPPQLYDLTTYSCFQLYFCYANVLKESMSWVAAPGSPNGGPFGHFLVKDRSLIGYDTLWNIFLNTQNNQVVEASMKFLNQLHECLHPDLKNEFGLQTLREDFISRCLEKLKESHIYFTKARKEEVDANQLETIKRRIERCLTLFLHQASIGQSSERHSSETNSNKPITIVVINTITKEDLFGTGRYKVDNDPQRLIKDEIVSSFIEIPVNEGAWNAPPFGVKEFEIRTHTQVTVGDIRKMIWEKLMSCEEMKSSGKKIVEDDLILKIQDHSDFDPSGDPKEVQKTLITQKLSQLNLLSGQKVYVHITPTLEGRETSMKARGVSKQANKVQLDAPLPADANEKIKVILDLYPIEREVAIFALRRKNWDTNQTANELYERLSDVVVEATKAGVFNNAEAPPPSQNQSNEIDKTSPSWILASNITLFNSLFGILGIEDVTTQKKVWDLLQTIPTAFHIRDSLFIITSKPIWDKLFDENQDTFKLLYNIQAIDNYLFSHTNPDWAAFFISTGGLNHLVKTFSSFAHGLLRNEHRSILLYNFECVARIMKILSFCISICIGDNNSWSTHASLIDSVRNLISHSTDQYWCQDKGVISDLIETLISVLSYSTNTQQSLESPDTDFWLSAIINYNFSFMELLCKSSTTNLLALKTLSNLSQSFQQVIKYLLFYSSLSVRDETSTGLFTLLFAVHQHEKAVPESITEFLVDCEPVFPQDLERSVWGIAGEYYELLVDLLDAGIGKQNTKLNEKLKKKVVLLLDEIMKRPIFEEGQHLDVDHVLRGKVMFLEVLLKRDISFAQEIPQELLKSGKLVSELCNDFLFTTRVESADSVVTRRSAGAKCKSRSSRVAAFDLVVELCKISPESFECLANQLFQIHTGKSKQLSSWYYHPSSNDKAASGYVGINNLGATCYMNSLLQQLFQIPSFRSGILDSQPLDKTPPKEPQMLLELQRMFSFLQESVMKSYDPQQFTKTCIVDGRPVNVSIQQDVDEFLNSLSSSLENQLKGSCYSHIFHKHFGVVLANEIRSVEPEYPYFSETQEEFLRIPLEVKNSGNIHKALDVLVACDKLEGDNAYNCEKYQKKLDANKRYCIKNLSNYLIFNLKRFEYDFNTDSKLKLNDYFSFPHILNIKPWTQEGLAGNSEDPVRPDWYYNYELCGVLVHSGSADSGHYYSYIKTNNENGLWYEFNDSRVSSFNVNSLERECFGGTQEVDTWDNASQKYIKRIKPIERSAYMLFYKRLTPEPIEYWGDDSDTSKLAQEDKEKILKVQELAREQSKQLKENEKRLINGVPAELYNEVWQQNADFLRDRTFFDPSYFDFMLSVSRILESPHPIPTVTLNHSRTIFHFIMEILTHAGDKTTLFRWVPLVRRIFSHTADAAKEFIRYMLAPLPKEPSSTKEAGSYVPFESDENLMKLMLIGCPQEATRVMAVDLLSDALITICDEEYQNKNIWGKAVKEIKTEKDLEEVSLCCQFVNSWVTMIDASRFIWRKFKQFFEVMKFFALAAPQNRDYLRSQDFIKHWHEYFMNSSSSGISRPQILDSDFFPDLRDYYEILEVLVCGARTEREIDGKLSIDNDDFYRTPYSPKGRLSPPLNQLELRTLYDHSFFAYLMDMDYHGPSISRLVCHASFECFARSQSIIYYVLAQTRNKYPVLINLTLQLLLLPDSLRTKRINWILSPFKITFLQQNTALGVLGFFKNEDKHRLLLIQAIMHIMIRSKSEKENEDPDTETIFKYLLKRRTELYTMKEILTTTLENAKEPIPNDPTPELIETTENKIRNRFPVHQNDVTATDLYIVVSQFLDKAAAGTSATWERLEKEQLHQQEHLRTELKKLENEQRQIKKKLENHHQYYKQKVPAPYPEKEVERSDYVPPIPDTPPPALTPDVPIGADVPRVIETDKPTDEVITSIYTQPIPTIQDEKEENDKIPELIEMKEINSNSGKENQVSVPPLPLETMGEGDKANLATLRAIMPQLSDDVLRVALEFNHNDVSQAANSLFDDSTIESYTREAENRKKQVRSFVA